MADPKIRASREGYVRWLTSILSLAGLGEDSVQPSNLMSKKLQDDLAGQYWQGVVVLSFLE